jgi:hypothetical protein
MGSVNEAGGGLLLSSLGSVESSSHAIQTGTMPAASSATVATPVRVTRGKV